jgi:hypothetical protein
VGTLEPGREGYVLPMGVCLTAGGETISVAEKASQALGCAVSPALKVTTPTQPFENGLTPPSPDLVEPRRGFGKTWRELYGGADGGLGWATEDEHSEAASWQQFEKGLVIVFPSGQGYIMYYDGNTWEQRNR